MVAVWAEGLSPEHVKLPLVTFEFVSACPWQPYHTPRYADPSAVGQVMLAVKVMGTFVHPFALAEMVLTIGGAVSRHRHARLPQLETVHGPHDGYDHQSPSWPQ